MRAVLGLDLLLRFQVGEYQGRIVSDKITEGPFIYMDSLLIVRELCWLLYSIVAPDTCNVF